MPATLTIRNVPDYVTERLRTRAKQNHRSLQGELMAVIEAAATESAPSTKAPLQWPSEATRFVRDSRDIDGAFEETPGGIRRMRRLTPSEALARARAKNIRTPGSVTAMIRQMRDER